MKKIEEIVQFATYSDIAQMVEICAENLVENNREEFSSGNLSQRGFLIKKLEENETKKMIDDQKNFCSLVVKKEDKVLGYLTACDLKKTDENIQQQISQLIASGKFGENFDDKIFFYKQIAKRISEKNIGSKLLLAFYDEAKKRGYSSIVCRIVHSPQKNLASISFHQKFGFEEIAEVEENGALLGIYLKQI